MGLKELHNMVPIDSDIEKQIVSIREKLKPNTKLSEKDNHIVKTAYKAITGKNPPNGCNSCNSTIKIINNWLNGFYDVYRRFFEDLKDVYRDNYTLIEPLNDLSGNEEIGFMDKMMNEKPIETKEQNTFNVFTDEFIKEVSETIKPTYKELIAEAKELGFIKEGKGRVKMELLKQFINDNK